MASKLSGYRGTLEDVARILEAKKANLEETESKDKARSSEDVALLSEGNDIRLEDIGNERIASEDAARITESKSMKLEETVIGTGAKILEDITLISEDQRVQLEDAENETETVQIWNLVTNPVTQQLIGDQLYLQQDLLLQNHFELDS